MDKLPGMFCSKASTSRHRSRYHLRILDRSVVSGSTGDSSTRERELCTSGRAQVDLCHTFIASSHWYHGLPWKRPLVACEVENTENISSRLQADLIAKYREWRKGAARSRTAQGHLYNRRLSGTRRRTGEQACVHTSLPNSLRRRNAATGGRRGVSSWRIQITWYTPGSKKRA